MGTIAGSSCSRKAPSSESILPTFLAIHEVKPETTKLSPDIAELNAEASTS